MALTDDTHDLVTQYFAGRKKTLAVDATCGNGHDTEFLLSLGFAKVIAFDIQPQALAASRAKIRPESQQKVRFVLAGHEYLADHVKDPIDCIMFNLGYLPGASKATTTKAETTMAALQQATHLLNEDGLISLVCYPGHPAGAIEKEILVEWFATIRDTWRIDTHLASAPKPTAPILFTMHKKST